MMMQVTVPQGVAAGQTFMVKPTPPPRAVRVQTDDTHHHVAVNTVAVRVCCGGCGCCTTVGLLIWALTWNVDAYFDGC